MQLSTCMHACSQVESLGAARAPAAPGSIPATSFKLRQPFSFAFTRSSPGSRHGGVCGTLAAWCHMRRCLQGEAVAHCDGGRRCEGDAAVVHVAAAAVAAHGDAAAPTLPEVDAR